MEKIKTPARLWVQTILVFFAIFLLINSAAHTQIQHQKSEAELTATYTAEATVRRIESQLNQYLAKSDLLNHIKEAGYRMDEDQFNTLASLMLDKQNVIEAVELAPGGIVEQVYPASTNKEAIGLNLLENADRKASAELAMKSGSYTIAGPFELVQGGTGALLFDPVYITDENRNSSFWGFTLIVINWDHFLDTLQLNKLEESSYYYRIWKENLSDGSVISLAQSQETPGEDALEVLCDVPNDVWHFDIIPKGGWYSGSQLLIDSLLCLMLSGFAAMAYWQFTIRRYRDTLYAEEIRKSADAARRANQAKTSFLSRMSHDIRTPLNGIIGLLKIDENHAADQEMLAANHEKMMVAANHLLDLINDVLQMSKLESGEVVLSHEVIDLNQIAMDVLTIMEQRAAEAGITMEYDSSLEKVLYPIVYGSPLHLRQLFLNIYGNSVKYNEVGGKVYTHFECLGISNGIVTYRWTISDTGIGMSQEFLDHIFEPFAQEHSDARSVYHGTGLGMAIVKALVDEMHGSIEVSSTVGEGSTFVITLPFELAEKEEMKQPESEGKEEVSIRGLRFLMAEDNELNAEIAEILLQDEGAVVVTVRDGQEAIDCFEKHPAGTFDAILMDIMMPRVDGISATAAIRSLEREDAKTIPIIAMTANAYEEDAKKCIAAGMNAHLSKPLRMEEVVAVIAECCREK